MKIYRDMARLQPDRYVFSIETTKHYDKDRDLECEALVEMIVRYDITQSGKVAQIVRVKSEHGTDLEPLLKSAIQTADSLGCFFLTVDGQQYPDLFAKLGFKPTQQKILYRRPSKSKVEG